MDGGIFYLGMLLMVLFGAGLGSVSLVGFVGRRVKDSPGGHGLTAAAGVAPFALAGALVAGFVMADSVGADYQTLNIDGNVFTGMGGGYFENSWDETSWEFYRWGISGVAGKQPVPAGIGQHVAQYGCADTLPALILTDDQNPKKPPAFILLHPQERSLSVVAMPSALNAAAQQRAGQDVMWVSRDTFYQTCAVTPASIPVRRALTLWAPVLIAFLLFLPLWIGLFRLPWAGQPEPAR